MPAVGPRAAPVVREEGVAEREDGVVILIDCSVGVVEVFEFVVSFGRFEGEPGGPGCWRWGAVVADPVSYACDCLVLLFEIGVVVVVVPRRGYERRHWTLALLSLGALTLAEKEDCCAEESYGGCDADGYADVGACCEVAAGG